MYGLGGDGPLELTLEGGKPPPMAGLGHMRPF